MKIENVVASSYLGRELDLNVIEDSLEGAEYNPKRFPGLVYRLDDPKVVVLLFSSGKMVCTGAKVPPDVNRAVDKIAAELRSVGLMR